MNIQAPDFRSRIETHTGNHAPVAGRRTSQPRQVTIRGTTYASYAIAAKALRVTESAVRSGVRNGSLHRVGLGKRGVEPMRISIAGKEFRDAKAAAKHFGVCRQSIYAAINAGDPDRISRARRYNPARAVPFDIGGLTFPSMRAASTALGFKSPEFIGKAIKHGSKRGRERIIAAAMRYVVTKAKKS